MGGDGTFQGLIPGSPRSPPSGPALAPGEPPTRAQPPSGMGPSQDPGRGGELAPGPAQDHPLPAPGDAPGGRGVPEPRVPPVRGEAPAGDTDGEPRKGSPSPPCDLPGFLAQALLCRVASDPPPPRTPEDTRGPPPPPPPQGGAACRGGGQTPAPPHYAAWVAK